MLRNILIFQKRSYVVEPRVYLQDIREEGIQGEITSHRGGKDEHVNGKERHTEKIELGEGGLQR